MIQDPSRAGIAPAIGSATSTVRRILDDGVDRADRPRQTASHGDGRCDDAEREIVRALRPRPRVAGTPTDHSPVWPPGSCGHLAEGP